MHGAGDELAMVQALSSAAEVLSSAAANHFASDNNQQPRINLTNAIGYQWGRSLRAPWMELNQALAAIRDGVLVIEDRQPRDRTGRSGHSADPGICEAYAGAQPRPTLRTSSTRGSSLTRPWMSKRWWRTRDLRPYGDIAQAARGYLQAARQIASQNSFTIPAGWMGTSVSSEDFVRMVNSWEARLMTTVARTPEERAAGQLERGAESRSGRDDGRLWHQHRAGRHLGTTPTTRPHVLSMSVSLAPSEPVRCLAGLRGGDPEGRDSPSMWRRTISGSTPPVTRRPLEHSSSFRARSSGTRSAGYGSLLPTGRGSGGTSPTRVSVSSPS